MNKSTIIVVCTAALALTACKSTPQPQYTDITSNPESTFDHVMIDYLSQTELTDDVVRHFIASNRFTQRELNLREESGVGVDTFISAMRKEIKTRIQNKPATYSYFFNHELNAYNAQKGYFPLVSNNEAGGVSQEFKNEFYVEKLTAGQDAFRRAGTMIDLTGWVVPISDVNAYAVIKTFPDRKIPTYVTYKLNSCKYNPKAKDSYLAKSEYIRCKYDVISVNMYNTPKFNNYTRPMTKATQLIR